VRHLWLLLVLAGCANLAAPRPTQNGDVVGTATMQADGTIHMQLRSVECDGTIAEGANDLPPKTPGNKATLERIGALKPGESKPLLASGLEPCPKN